MVREHSLSDFNPFCTDRDFLVAQATVRLVNTTHAVEKKVDVANVETVFYKHHSGEGGHLSQVKMVRGKVPSFFHSAHSKRLPMSEDSGLSLHNRELRGQEHPLLTFSLQIQSGKRYSARCPHRHWQFSLPHLAGSRFTGRR